LERHWQSEEAREAAFRRLQRIQMDMKKEMTHAKSGCRARVVRAAFLSPVLFLMGLTVRAQDLPQGPLTPPPEHDVRRVTGATAPEAPPAMPPEEIIKRFSQKEDEFAAARGRYAYHKTIRIQEFAPDGKPGGEFLAALDAVRASDGKVFEKFAEPPQSTLHYLKLTPEDAEVLTRIPAYPLISSQLSKYNLKYLGKEKVDEIECYIFQVKPKEVERQHALFDGVIWVDDKYLEVVKTYGKWVSELGDVHSPTLPFSMFETYRENIDGKYWIPNYSRSEDVLHLQDQNVLIRVTIKWADFKAFPGVAPTPDKPAAPPAKPLS
jgi:hypothetical protein